ncbi:hypothetical protein [Rhodopila sp.]|uniref:hypothetical protein n=1 Tax=Rhodopila sp. TaxID=2480087 RepID=UPI003D113AF3
METQNKRPPPYILGSIWKRRDGKQAVIISDELHGRVRAVAVGSSYPAELPYLVYADFGHVSKTENENPMDLISRDEDGIVCKCGEIVDVA